ncbi:MAG: hypothetical protein LUF02_00615 [Erysipelotrichaceae bacterium]|nr:hypothetical protein [Erysipelotrichaceae bacterium]
MDLSSKIKNNIDIRDSLIAMKSQISSLDTNDEELKEQLIKLLSDEDAKIRKNSAILLGYFPNTISLLLELYKQEKKEYVKEAYLKGIANQNCSSYLEQLKDIQIKLIHSNQGEAKHIQAQLKILNPLILQYQSHKRKVIKLKHEPIDVVLTSIPYYQFVLFEPVLHLRYKPVTQGVLVRTESIYELLDLRTYNDMLIPLQGASGLDINIESIEAGIRRCNIVKILDKLYDDESFFYYKVEDLMRQKDSALIKKISEKFFEYYPYKLLNTMEDYEIEIVVKEVRKGKVNLYLRLSHFKSNRFSYRKETISNSMQSYVAATLVQLAKPYMIDHAKVVDPFAGCGTLLIERNIVKATKFSMGIDIYGKGIEAAKKNTKIAGQTIYYVHKDSLRFVNNEMFDEIITDMPTFPQLPDRDRLTDLYDRFFERIHRLVKSGGYVFLYTSEISLVRKNLRLQSDYLSLIEHYEIPRGKHMFYFFIMQVI